jgi:colanic acid/amylovoran biosynthesis protein
MPMPRPRTTPSRLDPEAGRHVLVVNQHGDNTGDESAVRGMLAGLEEHLAPVRFTVVHQFRERSSEVDVDQPVRWITMVLPGTEPLRLVVYSLLMLVRLRRPGILGPVGRATIEAYESADLVVSAPGGPYFGDVYWSHEPVHWFYVWLARWHRVPWRCTRRRRGRSASGR